MCRSRRLIASILASNPSGSLPLPPPSLPTCKTRIQVVALAVLLLLSVFKRNFVIPPPYPPRAFCECNSCFPFGIDFLAAREILRDLENRTELLLGDRLSSPARRHSRLPLRSFVFRPVGQGHWCCCAHDVTVVFFSFLFCFVLFFSLSQKLNLDELEYNYWMASICSVVLWEAGHVHMS